MVVRAYKTEINPSSKQKQLIHKTIGVCRFINNFYIARNKEVYKKEKHFVLGMEFSKWLNNEFIPNNQEYKWIKEVSSKAVKQSIMNGEKAFKRFFNGQSKFPRFKKKRNQDIKAYFPKNNKTDWTVERHRIKIPTFGFVRLKEKGYIPINAKVISGTVSYKAGRYYVSVLVKEENQVNNHLAYTSGIGIDLGLKEFAVISNGVIKSNINKTTKVKKLEKKLKREQRRLSRKYENKKKRGEKSATRFANIDRQILKIQKLHQRLNNIQIDYINKIVSELVKTKPEFITIEDLNIKGMMKNRHLSKAVAQQNFYSFRTKLQNKCKQLKIELRVVSRFYPSSKLCSYCGNVKKDLKLSNRVYSCKECGYENDRDLNAAINLRNAKEYTIAC
ncbi:transposase [Bacillota bacterium LX-D]|nr:transposase [Bacillota bacterium LX-D]